MADVGRRLFFVSYTRTDWEKVQELLQGLERLKYQVWLDREISGGQEWWDTILERIRSSDALILAVSQAALESDACRSEASYARQLNRPVLPVMIEPVPTNLLFPEIARLNVVDFTGGLAKVFDLIGAINQMPAPGPLPDPLPSPPAIPISYLSDLSSQVHAAQLSFNDQHGLVGRLKAGLQRPRDRQDVLELLRILRTRQDIYASAAQEIDRILADAGGGWPGGATTGSVTAGAATGDAARRDTALSNAQIRRAPTPSPPPPSSSPPSPSPRSGGWGPPEVLTVLGMFVCAPLALIAVWFTPWSGRTKVLLAILVALIWLVAYLVLTTA